MKRKQSILTVVVAFIATALIGSNIAASDNIVFATKSTQNDAFEGIGQGSETFQSSTCDSHDGKTIAGCNNLDTTLNLNFANNALGQQ